MRGPHFARALCLALVGCGPTASSATDAGRAASVTPASEVVRGQVVATVDGVRVTREEVERVARDVGIAPADALRRMEEEIVLGALAERELGPDDGEASDATRRAAVQALIEARVEREVTPSTIPADAVEARRSRDAARFTRPERRRSTHALARVPQGAGEDAWAAAERWARRAQATVRAGDDPEASLRALALDDSERRAFRVVVEDLPAVSRDDEFVQEYLDPLFRAPALGLLEAPVRTQFGWHVVLLQEIVAPWSAPPEEVEAALREELCTEQRAARLDALVDTLRARTPVELDDARARALLQGIGDGPS